MFQNAYYLNICESLLLIYSLRMCNCAPKGGFANSSGSASEAALQQSSNRFVCRCWLIITILVPCVPEKKKTTYITFIYAHNIPFSRDTVKRKKTTSN